MCVGTESVCRTLHTWPHGCWACSWRAVRTCEHAHIRGSGAHARDCGDIMMARGAYHPSLLGACSKCSRCTAHELVLSWLYPIPAGVCQAGAAGQALLRRCCQGRPQRQAVWPCDSVAVQAVHQRQAGPQGGWPSLCSRMPYVMYAASAYSTPVRPTYLAMNDQSVCL